MHNWKERPAPGFILRPDINLAPVKSNPTGESSGLMEAIQGKYSLVTAFD
jgi:hypothetical protein